MSWHARGDLPALASGALVLPVTAGLPPGWRAGLALAVTALLLAGARFRSSLATTLGLLLLVGIVAGGNAVGGDVVGGPALVALATGSVAVATTSAGRTTPAPIDARTRTLRVLPVVGAVLAASPVALLVTGTVPSASGWAVLGGGVLVAVLLVAAMRAGPPLEPS